MHADFDRPAGLSGALVLLLCLFGVSSAATPPASTPKGATMTDVLAAASPADWRPNDAANTLYLDLDEGRVVMELAPTFAPQHVANIKRLVAARYFDGLAITRVQDNFVVQWGDPDNQRSTAGAARTLPAEFDQPTSSEHAFTQLPDVDGYAPQVGFANGLPVARDLASKRIWLTHCYGTLAVGRDNAPDSGSGTELYVVIGHAPRQLDRNTTVVGRVLRGMELLASLPRGTAPMGFYDKTEPGIAIRSIRLAAELPAEQRTPLEVLRTDTPTFEALIEARRNRRDEWYVRQSGHIDLCNVPIPVRDAGPGATN